MKIVIGDKGLPDPLDVRLLRDFGIDSLDRFGEGLQALVACAACVPADADIFLGVRYVVVPEEPVKMIYWWQSDDGRAEDLLVKTFEANGLNKFFDPGDGKAMPREYGEKQCGNYPDLVKKLAKSELYVSAISRRSEPVRLEKGGSNGQTVFLPVEMAAEAKNGEGNNFLDSILGHANSTVLVDFTAQLKAGKFTLSNENFWPVKFTEYLDVLQEQSEVRRTGAVNRVSEHAEQEKIRKSKDRAGEFVETEHSRLFIHIVSTDEFTAQALAASVISHIGDPSSLQLNTGTYCGLPHELVLPHTVTKKASVYEFWLDRIKADCGRLSPECRESVYNEGLNSLYPLSFIQKILQPPMMTDGYLPRFRASSDELCAVTPGHSVLTGKDIDRGGLPLHLSPNDLTRHLFISGRSGSGKTTTIRNLLINLYHKHETPFLLIEPVKGEYRNLLLCKNEAGKPSLAEDLVFFTPGREDQLPMRINPLEPFRRDRPLIEHLEMVEELIVAAFSLGEGPAPMILKRALLRVYQEKGWPLFDVPNEEMWLTNKLPNLRDLREASQKVLAEMGYDPEIRDNLAQVFDTRLQFLESGSVGRLFNCRESSPRLEELLNKPVVLELDALRKDQKSLVTLLLLNALWEFGRQHYEQDRTASRLRHLAVVEEAHNLVTRPKGGDEGYDPTAEVSEFLCKMLAEVRAMGQGVILADQSADKMPQDVLRNTATKIVHACSDAADRETLADNMMLGDAQLAMLTNLSRGLGFYMARGYVRPAMIDVDRITPVTEDEEDQIITPHEFYRSMATCDIHRQFLRGQLHELSEQFIPQMAEAIKLGHERFEWLDEGATDTVPKSYLQKVAKASQKLREDLSEQRLIDGRSPVDNQQTERMSFSQLFPWNSNSVYPLILEGEGSPELRELAGKLEAQLKELQDVVAKYRELENAYHKTELKTSKREKVNDASI